MKKTTFFLFVLLSLSIAKPRNEQANQKQSLIVGSLAGIAAGGLCYQALTKNKLYCLLAASCCGIVSFKILSSYLKEQLLNENLETISTINLLLEETKNLETMLLSLGDFEVYLKNKNPEEIVKDLNKAHNKLKEAKEKLEKTIGSTSNSLIKKKALNAKIEINNLLSSNIKDKQALALEHKSHKTLALLEQNIFLTQASTSIEAFTNYVNTHFQSCEDGREQLAILEKSLSQAVRNKLNKKNIQATYENIVQQIHTLKSFFSLLRTDLYFKKIEQKPLFHLALENDIDLIAHASIMYKSSWPLVDLQHYLTGLLKNLVQHYTQSNLLHLHDRYKNIISLIQGYSKIIINSQPYQYQANLYYQHQEAEKERLFRKKENEKRHKQYEKERQKQRDFEKKELENQRKFQQNIVDQQKQLVERTRKKNRELEEEVKRLKKQLNVKKGSS